MVKAKNKEYKLIKPKKYKETLEYKNNELKINELNNFFTKDNTNNKIYYPYKIKNNLWGGSRIEPIEYDKMIKNKFPLPNKYVRGCLVGTSGSGKSYLLTSLIDCLPHIECAVIASKLYNNKYHGAICSYLNDHQIPAYLVHDPYEVMEKIEYMVNNYKNEKLIIFDDFDNKSKNKDEIYNKIKNISFSMLRNYKCHMFNVTQDINTLDTSLQTNLNVLGIFKVPNIYSHRTLKMIYESMTNRPQAEYMNLIYEMNKY